MVVLTYLSQYNDNNFHYMNYVMTPHFRCKLFMEYYDKWVGDFNWVANRNHLFNWV